MSEFKGFRQVVKEKFNLMAKGELFRVDLDKDLLWDTYLKSFPEGTNPMFKERTEHDCNTCKQFIRNVGNVISIVDNKLVSIWDVKANSFYQVVADTMSGFVKSHDISNLFRHPELKVGMDANHVQEEDKIRTFNHFNCEVPRKFHSTGDAVGNLLSDFRATRDVFFRSMSEITLESAEIVRELIAQNSLYRGQEYLETVKLFIKHKKAFDKVVDAKEKDAYCWFNVATVGHAVRIRNTVIGTLLTDISANVDLDVAVRSFESKVAPTNYKRPTALITKGMIEQAEKTVVELGIQNSLQRRFAVQDDITINNVLFADRSIKKANNIFDDLKASTSSVPKNLDKIEEISIDKFLKNVVPMADTIELLVENKHAGNFMSLIAPTDKDAPNILKWNNNFSWCYNGEVADSMKERVKAAGGKVDGVLRFSIQWNEDGNNQVDLDAHAIEPILAGGRHIFFGSHKGSPTPFSGVLDVDIISPGNKIAVENITWSSLSKMLEGKYKFYVNNYSSRNSSGGFTAEIEYDGQVWSFVYDKNIKGGDNITVAEINFSKTTGVKIITSLPSAIGGAASRDIWGVSTNNFIPVKMIMNSPNHWDGNKTGNKHFFFILDGCKTEEQQRGFFNEFLSDNLTKHRKVFEVLGSKMKVAPADDILGGLGFSETVKASVVAKVTGSFSRTIKIIF